MQLFKPIVYSNVYLNSSRCQVCLCSFRVLYNIVLSFQFLFVLLSRYRLFISTSQLERIWLLFRPTPLGFLSLSHFTKSLQRLEIGILFVGSQSISFRYVFIQLDQKSG